MTPSYCVPRSAQIAFQPNSFSCFLFSLCDLAINTFPVLGWLLSQCTISTGKQLCYTMTCWSCWKSSAVLCTLTLGWPLNSQRTDWKKTQTDSSIYTSYKGLWKESSPLCHWILTAELLHQNSLIINGLQPLTETNFSASLFDRNQFIDRLLLLGRCHTWIENRPVPAEPAEFQSIYGQL